MTEKIQSGIQDIIDRLISSEYGECFRIQETNRQPGDADNSTGYWYTIIATCPIFSLRADVRQEQQISEAEIEECRGRMISAIIHMAFFGSKPTGNAKLDEKYTSHKDIVPITRCGKTATQMVSEGWFNPKKPI